MMGVTYNGQMLEFPTIDAFETALNETNKVLDWTVGTEGQSPINREVVSIVDGFWSLNHVLQHVQQQREAAWKAGKLKENEKSAPILEKFIAGQGLRALLNAEGVVKIQDLTLKFTAEGQVLKQEGKGKFIPHPEEKSDSNRITEGGPRSLCCITAASQTRTQSINQTDRLVAQMQMHRIFWMNRFIFSASSTYQRLIHNPFLGMLWADTATNRIGAFIYGSVNRSCNESHFAYRIPNHAYSMPYNTHIASISWMGMAYPGFVATELSSLHGCLIKPGFHLYGC